jgi:hypothetical protein
VRSTPHGLSVWSGACQNLPPEAAALPILYVGPSGFGGTLINVYQPNNYQGGRNQEPFVCVPGGSEPWQVNAVPGVGRSLRKIVPATSHNVGIFTAEGNAPAGYHLNVQSGERTPLTTCNADKTGRLCPVSSGDQQNYLVTFTTGGELFGCPDVFIACTPPRSGLTFGLAPAGPDGPTGDYEDQELTFFGYAGLLGQEQANIRISPGTAAGEKRLRVTVPDGPASLQELVVRLGAPE